MRRVVAVSGKRERCGYVRSVLWRERERERSALPREGHLERARESEAQEEERLTARANDDDDCYALTVANGHRMWSNLLGTRTGRTARDEKLEEAR